MSFCNRLKMRREELGMSQDELAKKMGYKSRSTINKIELGINDVSQSKIAAFAKALDTTVGYLMDDKNDDRASYNYENIFPLNIKRFPLLGEIACGEPKFITEDRESYVLSGTNINADFCLKCVGDSMTGARIFDGDIVFIRKQEMVNNGEIAAVIINNEATLKRWYYYPEKNKLVLNAENNKYEPLVYIGDELNEVRCLGKAIAFQSDVI